MAGDGGWKNQPACKGLKYSFGVNASEYALLSLWVNYIN